MSSPDAILEAPGGHYLVSADLRRAIEQSQLSGCSFTDAEITRDLNLRADWPNADVPMYFHLKIDGRPGVDDFGSIHATRHAVVSRRALGVIRAFKSEYVEAQPFIER